MTDVVPSKGLTIGELNDLIACKESQPGWWAAMIEAARVMPVRRAKYSGGLDQSPYTNFIIMARLLGVPVSRVFLYYQVIKLARGMMDTGDFDDEGAPDTPRDLANYALLEAGWRMMGRDEQLEHERQAGGWTNTQGGG